MRSLCHECIALPIGLAGHDSLIIESAEIGEDPVFLCVACASRWRRRYVGQGKFSWTPLVPFDPEEDERPSP